MGQQLIVAHISVKISTLRLCKTLVFQQGWCIADMESGFSMFLSDKGSTLETLNFAFYFGSTPTFLYFDFYLNTAYAAHYVYFIIYFLSFFFSCTI